MEADGTTAGTWSALVGYSATIAICYYCHYVFGIGLKRLANHHAAFGPGIRACAVVDYVGAYLTVTD